ncbi:phosphorylase [Spirochaetia bacterium]|nr:phosphorylase [Spirochaetia bacterium]
MPLVKNEFPILEYDTEPNGLIMPGIHGKGVLPPNCVMVFFSEALDEYVMGTGAEKIISYKSEMGKFPAYKTCYKDTDICLIQAIVGSASIAMMTEFLIAHGVKRLIACGGCGVLKDIPVGDVILPTSALRDEGASYHYLPPAREIILDELPVRAVKQTLDKFSTPYIECKTWTTDAFFRETPEMIKYRKEEGCSVVEMECAAIAAVSRFRGILFGQLLYSGDILADTENYDERGWYNKLPARKKLFTLAMESIVELNSL